MKFIYIKLSDNLVDALYQAISALIISEYQEGMLAFEPTSKFKNNILKNYFFKNIVCRNTYNEKIQGNYNCFTTKFYKYNLELIGEFKNIGFFLNRVDEFVKTLYVDGYKNEINQWLNEINEYKKNINSKNIYSLNLYSNKYVNSVEHRGGWKDIITNLFDNNILSVNDVNYYLIDTVENYIRDNNLIIKKKWFGIVHSTQNTPDFLSITKISDIISSNFFQKNKINCLGLITFSQNIKNILDNYNLNINVLFVKHPINTENIDFFNLDKFMNNNDKCLVLLGKQLRKSSTIYLINTKYKKNWLPGTKQHVSSSITNLKKELEFMGKNDNVDFNSVEIKYFDTYKEYDEHILTNIVIIDLWDANANNSILECLIRNIPFFVSKLTEVVEYLGHDYPMYFNSFGELENILNENNINALYLNTYNYLKNIDKYDITFNHFNAKLDIFIKSNINKMEIIFSGIKEHNNWTFIEKYLANKFYKINLSNKIIFIPFVDIFILDKITLETTSINNFNWIGILHNPNLSEIYPESDIFVKKNFLNYLNFCKGLFVMSEELKKYIINKFNPKFFVEVLTHPLPHLNVCEWNFQSFINNNNKKIIQVGNWLRKTYGIFKIKVPQYFTKAITPFGDRTKNELKFWSERDDINITDYEYESVLKYTFVENDDYVKLFQSNIFFLHLYDSTANNIILECIKSNCPIIVNDNLNVKKYLGDEYPLYYKNYEQIPVLLTDTKIFEAHLYLKNINKSNFDNEYLYSSIFDVLKLNGFII